MKKCMLKKVAKLVKHMAIKSSEKVSLYGMYEPKVPAKLRKNMN